MESASTTPEEAARIRARWRIDPEELERRLVDELAAHGVDTARLTWLSSEETRSVVQRWIEDGAQRYGRLALVPPPDSNVHRGEFGDGELPTWLDAGPRRRETFISFSRPAGGPRRIARCEFGFVIDNLASLARADGDGFAAVTSGLEGVLLVNVDDRLGDSRLEIDAWGEFIRDDPE
jgi:hypothetical protein